MTVSPDDSAAPFLNDEYFMRAALRLAETAAANDEVPIGAVAVRDGVIIARGWNQVETLKDATAHAELLAMTAAASAVVDWRLDGVTVYVTKEPCAMCALLNVSTRTLQRMRSEQRIGYVVLRGKCRYHGVEKHL